MTGLGRFPGSCPVGVCSGERSRPRAACGPTEVRALRAHQPRHQDCRCCQGNNDCANVFRVLNVPPRQNTVAGSANDLCWLLSAGVCQGSGSTTRPPVTRYRPAAQHPISDVNTVVPQSHSGTQRGVPSGRGPLIVVGVAGQAAILACPHCRRDGQIVVSDAHVSHRSTRPVGHRLQRIIAHHAARCRVVGVADEQPYRGVVTVIGAPGLPVCPQRRQGDRKPAGFGGDMPAVAQSRLPELVSTRIREFVA